MALSDLASQLEAQLGEAVSLNTSVSDLTTYRLGGPVAVVVRVFSENDLVTVGQSISSAQDEIPLIVIGRGSNLLVADSGFMGVGIILDGEFTEVKIEPGLRVAAATERCRLFVFDKRQDHQDSLAIPSTNIEVKTAVTNGWPVVSRAEALRALSLTHRSVAVAGSHGSFYFDVGRRNSGRNNYRFSSRGDIFGFVPNLSIDSN